MRNSILLVLLAFIFIYCQSNVYSQGERLYGTYCGNCHGKDGNGLKNLYPPLNNSDFYKENIDQVPCIILNGLEEAIVVNGKKYNMPMAAVPNLTDIDITNLMNYINTAWENDLPEVNINDVKGYISKCNQ